MINVTGNHDTVTIQLTGRFDFRLIKDFQTLLERKPRIWIVDLSLVDYVDSSALGMLLLLREQVRGDAQRVQLKGLHGQPRDVLVMARFDKMFKVV